MFDRRSLRTPITLGVILIILVVVLTIFFVVISAIGIATSKSATLFTVALPIGSVLFVVVLLGVIAYLTISIKAVNLNRRQSNFIDSVTHELKSPIASLKLYLQTLARRNVDPQQQEDFHRYMLEDVERLDHLINHLLDAARIERTTISQNVETIDLHRLISDCCVASCVRYRVPSEFVTIDCPLVNVRCHPVELNILLRNLIDNAVKYCDDPPEVAIRVQRRPGNRLSIKVIDNGPGIPAPLRRKIFGRFVRLGSELERSKPGTGLGLYLVRNAVKKLQGIVQVRDRSGGGGTEFEVILQGIDVSPKQITDPKTPGDAEEATDSPELTEPPDNAGSGIAEETA